MINVYLLSFSIDKKNNEKYTCTLYIYLYFQVCSSYQLLVQPSLTMLAGTRNKTFSSLLSFSFGCTFIVCVVEDVCWTGCTP